MGTFGLKTLRPEHPAQAPYDRYEVVIEDIGAVVVSKWADWPAQQSRNQTEPALVERFGVPNRNPQTDYANRISSQLYNPPRGLGERHIREMSCEE